MLGTLGAILLGNWNGKGTGKGIVTAGSGCCSLSVTRLNSSTSYGNKKEKGIVRAGYGKEWDF